MTVIDEFIEANKTYSSRFDKGELPMPPARKVAVVVCMDARIDPARALGFEEGDAHVIRNAGGRARDAIRSLAISHQLLGTREFAVIHHTDCGMLTFEKDQLRQLLSEELGDEAARESAAIDFLPFKDLDRSVREDVEEIRASPLIPDDIPVRGFVYHVESGAIREVV